MIKNKRLLICSSLILSLLSTQGTSTILASNLINSELQNMNFVASKSEPGEIVSPDISDILRISNMFADISQDKTIARGGQTILDLGIYNIADQAMRLPSIYLVLPRGITAKNGLAGVEKTVADYEEYRKINGHLQVKKLPSTNDNREVYRILPTNGAYTVPGEIVKLMQLPVEVTKKAPQTIRMNAKTDSEIQDTVVFAGAGDGENVTYDDWTKTAYHQFNTETIGIQSDTDQFVMGIVYPSYHKEVGVFSPQVKDTYNIIDNSDNDRILNTITKQGKIFSSYSRSGLVDSLQRLGLDESVYDEKSLKIDSGGLTDSVELTVPNEKITNDENQIYNGHIYNISIKQFAKKVTVKYVDMDGNELHESQILDNGDVGDKYDVSTPDYKLNFDGYHLAAEPNNAVGTFGKNTITVTYQYQKNKSAVNVHDSIIVAGTDSWTAEDNWDSAFDEAGNPVSFEEVQTNGKILGTVDTTTPGVYPITYTYQNASAIANVVVKSNQGVAIENRPMIDIETIINPKIIEKSKAPKKISTGEQSTKHNKPIICQEKSQVKNKSRLGSQKNYEVVINYVDENNNKIAKSDIIIGKKGESYITRAKNIKGYVLRSKTSSYNGTFGVIDATKYAYESSKSRIWKDDDDNKDITMTSKNHLPLLG